MRRRCSQLARGVSALILRSAHAATACSRASWTRCACARLEGWGRTPILSLPEIDRSECASRPVRDGLMLRDASQRARARDNVVPRSRCDAPQHEPAVARADEVIE